MACGVYASRINSRKVSLQWTHPVDADMVVGVPESGNPAAHGLCHGIRDSLRKCISLRTTYVGRTFIKPKQSMQRESVYR